MMYSPMNTKRLSDEIRLRIIELHAQSGAGHLGSSLSVVELLVVLFFRHFRWAPEYGPRTAGDRFVLSKGHAAMAIYPVLAALGKIAPERLSSFGQNGSPLEPHPNERREPALHASTGSLGQGLSIGVGLALGSRLQGSDDRTFVLIGDGEANEGQVWEAARSAARLGLSNLVVVLDDNGMQQDGPMTDIMPVDDLAASWTAMGWRCATVDGHDCAGIEESLRELLEHQGDGPRLLHAHTVKGRGVAFLEGQIDSHYPPPLSAVDLEMVRHDLRCRNIDQGWEDGLQ